MSKIDNENETSDDCAVINFPGGPMHEVTASPIIPAPASLMPISPAPVSSVNPIASIQFPSPPPTRVKKVRRVGKRGKAKILDANLLQRFLVWVQATRHSPEADIVKIQLSYLAALRPCEIAGLHISDVTNADGSTADTIRIRPGATKGSRGREVPVCPALKQAIDAFRARHPESEWLAVSLTHRTLRHQNANAVSVFFHNLYVAAGLEGCSGHSGRRSFITHACRNLPEGASLRDVQVMVGHQRLDTTQAYIDCSKDSRDIANVIGAMFARRVGEDQQ
jgi:integrase/recombinase XerD